ncbi:DNA-binding transcriptional LysR family regulator [Nakamurella sp. UYEF19]|uniref:LysR substrate-binding domain-containing protein n=1 Tax=Nakamurella sp. UYEF19 TaxID=1756392 RepID=UPI0033950C7D
MNVELRHLRYFLAVADELHFGRAAEELHIAQPALSQQIQKLESMLGTVLLRRTSRSVALTPAGVVFRDRARAILRQSARDLAEVVRVGRGEQGRLDVGFVSSALHLGPIEHVERFRRRHRGVEVVLHEGFTTQLLARVVRGEIDVATVRDPDPLPGITTVALVTEPFVAIVPADHRLAAQDVVTGAQLAGDKFVFYPRTAGERAHHLNLLPVTETGRRPDIVQEASNWATIIYLIGAGLGVSIAPASATVAAPDNVRVLRLHGTAAESTLHLAGRTDEASAVVRNFLDSPWPSTTLSGTRPPGSGRSSRTR